MIWKQCNKRREFNGSVAKTASRSGNSIKYLFLLEGAIKALLSAAIVYGDAAVADCYCDFRVIYDGKLHFDDLKAVYLESPKKEMDLYALAYTGDYKSIQSMR